MKITRGLSLPAVGSCPHWCTPVTCPTVRPHHLPVCCPRLPYMPHRTLPPLAAQVPFFPTTGPMVHRAPLSRVPLHLRWAQGWLAAVGTKRLAPPRGQGTECRHLQLTAGYKGGGRDAFGSFTGRERAIGLRAPPRGHDGEHLDPTSQTRGLRPSPGEEGPAKSGAGASEAGCSLRAHRSCVSFPPSLPTRD